MRIAVGQLWQESNTFNPIPTVRASFDQFGVLRGPEVVERMATTNELGGFIQTLRTWPEKPEIVGLVRLPAWPAGAATADTFRWLLDEMVQALKAALPVDAVLLALHGAMVSETEPDVEGAVLREMRKILGPRIPLVATLDLHTNITKAMVEHANALVLYHTAPHIDVQETGERGARVMRRILDGARPVTAFQKIPMVVPAERANTQDPSSVSLGFRESLQALEKDPAILAAGLATVQPWLDIPEMGSAIVVVTDGDPARAEKECARLADEVWKRRRDYLPELTPLADAVRAAFEENQGLVVLSDSADATTSGAPGDSNHVLQELLKYDWPRPALVTMVDAGLVQDAKRLGKGAEWSGTIGGKRDNRFSQPISFTATIAGLFDAKFIMSGHLAKNMAIDMGPSAILRQGNVFVLVTTLSGPHFAPQFFQSAGIDPFAASVLIAKSPCGFRAAYADKARRIQVVQAPGCAPPDFWRYEYKNIPHPLWPWDEIPTWKAKPEIRKVGHE